MATSYPSAPSEYLFRIYNVYGNYNVNLYVINVDVERTGDVLTVSVDYFANGNAWNMWAYINGTSVFSKKWSGDSNTGYWTNPTPQSSSPYTGPAFSTITFTVADSDLSQHTNEMSYSAGYQQQRSGTSYYAKVGGGNGSTTSNPKAKFTYTVPAAGGLDENAISKIQVLSGTTYDICDVTTRELIAGVSSQVTRPLSFLGITETPLTDGSTTNPITIDDVSVTAVNGNVVIYDENEFVYSAADSKWHDFGSLSATGALASKDTASGTYVAAGRIGAPTFTGTAKAIQVTGLTIGGNITISASTAGTTNYRPAGSITAPGITVALTTATVNPMTSVGSLPTMTTTVNNGLLTFGWGAGTLPVKGTNQTVAAAISSVSVTQPIFQGTGAYLSAAFSGSSVTGSYTIKPTGTVSTPSFTGTGVSVTVT